MGEKHLVAGKAFCIFPLPDILPRAVHFAVYINKFKFWVEGGGELNPIFIILHLLSLGSDQ